MAESALPAGWAHIADLPLSELTPRRVLADHWEEAHDPAGPALRQICDVLDGRLPAEAVEAVPSALERAALSLFPPRPPTVWPPRDIRPGARPRARPLRLSPGEDALLPVWRHAWAEVVLAIDPADESAARQSVDAAYAEAGLPPAGGHRVA